MKSKLRNLLLAAMALTLFAGCSNIALNDAAVEGSDAGDKCMLTISVKDFFAQDSEERSARYIAPDKLKSNEIKKFRIEGTSDRGLVLNLDGDVATTLDDIELSTGSAEIALEYDVWHLKLHAYNDDNGDNEVLQGVTSIDLTKGIVPTDGIVFTMSTKGVKTNGGLSLTVTGTNSSVMSYYAGLYDINTDALVKELANENYTKRSDPDDEESPMISKGTEAISIESTDDIAPGSYIFKFIPYNNTKENAAIREDLTPWSDVITIAPGRTTEKNITVTIMEKPSKPEGFTVSLVEESEEDNDEYYTVRLNWTDTSSNEENFVLRIYEATATADYANRDAILAKTPVVFEKNFYDNNSYWVKGTLGMSTTECDVRLPTGHLYEFTLTAKNRAGQSDVCYREASEDNATDKLKGFAIEAGTGDAKPYVTVNRQKITYNLMGGTRITNVSSTDDIVEYRTYGAADYVNTLMVIDNSDGDANADPVVYPNKLIWEDHPFAGWTELPGDGSKITVIPSTVAYNDIIVYASYDQNVNISYKIADEYKTLAIESSVSGTTVDDIDYATLDSDNNKLTLVTTREVGEGVNKKIVSSGVTSGKIKFTIKGELKQKVENGSPVVDADGNPVMVTESWTSCDKIIILINGDVAGAKDKSLEYSYSLKNFKTSGVYNITVIAEVDGNYYSCDTIPLTVDLKAN